MATNTRVGFIGCGRHAGERIYPSLAPAGIELVATCDLELSRAEEYAGRFGAARAYDDYRRMCEQEELDAVCLVVGPEGHFRVALDLLDSGYPIWMEKPPAPTASEAEQLAEAVAAVGVHVQVGFNYRYTIGVRRAKSLIAGGQFAQPRLISLRWWLGGPHDGDHFLQHYVVHAVDLLGHLAGGLSRPDVRKAVSGDRFYYLVNLDAGAGAGSADERAVEGSVAALELSNHMDIRGRWSRIDWQSDSGMLSCADFETVTLVSGKGYHERPEATEQAVGSSGAGPAVSTVMQWDALGGLPTPDTSLLERWGYAPELRLFAAIVRGDTPAECTVADAARAMRIGEQILAIER